MPRCSRSTALLSTLLLATTAGCTSAPFEAAYEDDLGPLPVDPQVDLNAPIPEDAVFAMDRVIVAMADTSDGLPTTLSTDATQLDQLETIDGTRAALYEVPAGQDIRSLVELLRAEDGVLYAEPDYERVALADDPYLSYQWHMDAVGAEDAWLTSTGDGAVVAILDTGVSSGPYDGIGTLGQGYDFYNRDSDASDDNGHGTHVAGTVGQATDNGAGVAGLAYDATIMPVKVLGRSGGGSTSLVVAGINFAVNNGADVINMSLSFAEGYYPSPALSEALQAAADAGIVLVGAAGNDGANFTTYPAAHRAVISAGAIVAGSQQDAPIASAYSNRSARVDIVAPGGVVGDGGLGGIIAETIHPDDPTQVGLWQIAGTSQAAAVTSGAALYVLSTGLPPEQVRAAMQAGAYGFQNETHFYNEGLGGGWLRIDKAVEKACNGASGALEPDRFNASMMMWMTDEADGTIVPRARISVVDASGSPAAGVEPHVTIWGATGESASCVTDSTGVCDLAGPAAENGADLAWAFSLDAVVDEGVGVRPGNLLFGSDALEILLAGMANKELEHDGLAVHWPDVVDPELGDLAEGYMVMNAGTGLSSSPLGVVFQPSSPSVQHTNQTLSVDLDGTGLSSSPLGLTATTLFTPAPGAHDSDLLSFEGSQVDLSDGTVTVDAADSSIGALLTDGGFVTQASYPVASTLIGSGVVSTPSASVSAYPSGHGSEEL
jgi:hypothetical protein